MENQKQEKNLEKNINLKDEEKYFFHYVFQINKMVVFKVSYYILSNNSFPYFSTSASEFVKNKRDIDRGGQCQEDVLTIKNGGRKAKDFYKKFDQYHLKDLTNEQYAEIIAEIEKLKETYNYLEKTQPFTVKKELRGFSFLEEVELSKETPKSSMKKLSSQIDEKLSLEKKNELKL